MKNKVIEMLYNCKDDYISGERISENLGITRAAVWKSINAIKNDGGIIDAISGRGYKLIALPNLLKPEYLNLYLKNYPADIRWFKEINSTNNYLKELSHNKSIQNMIAIAEYQSEGKGRLGRTWTSEPEDSIQISFLLKPDAPTEVANAFNFAGALGICEAIENVCKVDVKIKWPNDIVFKSKKLCGILTEMSTDMNQIEYIVFGAGTNVNQKSFSGELEEKAISLRMITNNEIDRIDLCAAEIKYISDYFKMVADGKTDEIMDEYRQKSAIIGKHIYLITATDKIGGVCEDFGSGGELLLNINGTIKPFHAGEVSVRGEMGYV